MRPEHVKALSEAFSKTVKDPAFLAEAKNKKLDIDPTTARRLKTSWARGVNNFTRSVRSRKMVPMSVELMKF